MKKLYLLSAILLISLFMRCQSGDDKAIDTGRTATPADTSGTANANYTEDQDTRPGDGKDAENVMRVRRFLQSYLKDDLKKGLVDTMSRQFQLQVADLNNDGQDEIFVGLAGPYFCGSGGCTFLLLDPTGKLNTKFTVASYPVIVDSTLTNGWRDLLVQSRGKFHRLKFTGTKYPSNPSVAPVVDFPTSKRVLSIFDSWEERKEWHVF